MAGYRRIPKSYSFDPSMMYRRRQSPQGHELDSDVMDSSFGLKLLSLRARSPARSIPSHASLITSPTLSIASSQMDRSIEPMSVSDISEGDLGDESVDSPAEKLSTQHNEDSCSAASDGTQWLWSVKSAVHGVPSTASTVKQRIPISDKTNLDCQSDAMSVNSVNSDKTWPSVKNLQSDESIVESSNETRKDLVSDKCCTSCKYIIHFIVFICIITFMVTIMTGELNISLCEDGVRYDVDELRVDLEKNVFGQHLAVRTVLNHIKRLMDSTERNITVLSFHGWTGIGKNYVSSFVGAQLHPNAIHRIIIPLQFAHGKDSASHREQMIQQLVGGVVKCRLNLFVIDEVDKATEGCIDGLRMGLHSLTTMTLESTKVIVLLLSNSGGSAINRHLMDQLALGRPRESLDSDELINFMLKVNAAQIEQEWYVSLYEDHVIDAIVPFLPLEKSHVSLCAEHYITISRPMLGSSDKKEIVQRVVEQMSFFPQGVELFSSTGCRGVTFKVDLTID